MLGALQTDRPGRARAAWVAAIVATVFVAAPVCADVGASDLFGPALYALNDGPAPDALVPAPPATSITEPTPEPDPDDDWLDDEFSLDDEFADVEQNDPLEGFNRGVFAFNREFERFTLTPVTSVYQTIVPSVGRDGIHNVFLNADTPVRLTNTLLQGRPKATGVTLARFIVNTTFGLGGLIDVGSRVGLEKQQADFGQTLARWGTPQGPYLVFPVLGPMTIRHGAGMGVDFVMQPVSYVVGPLPGMIMGASKDFSRREQHVFELDSLRDSSIDFYASLRSAFLQDRADLVSAGTSGARLGQVASSGSDSLFEAVPLEEREARCLDHPRSRRDLWKGGLRRQTRLRCAAEGVAP